MRNELLKYSSLILTVGIVGSSQAYSASISTQPIEVIKIKAETLTLKTELEAHKASSRLHHAKELMGKYYQRSIVKASEGVTRLDEVLEQWTGRALKGKWKTHATQVAHTILAESDKYGFDPIFLMAVIENESSFNPEVVGGHGEIGLMQLTPETAKWVAEMYDLPWKGVKSLKNPRTNIELGSAYLAYLREKFDFHSQLYLAAYNMGSTNVMRAMGRQIWPKEYPTRVMQRYVRYYSELNDDRQGL